MLITSWPRSIALYLAVLLALLFPVATAPAQAIWHSPHGIFVIGNTFDVWTNPALDGLRKQVRWTDIQPESETAFDWSSIDKLVADANTDHKQLGLSLWLLGSPPAWLTSMPGVKTYQLPPKNDETLSMVLPWNPIVQSKLINFITKLCQRYDGKVDYIVMGGLGAHTETCMPEPEDIGLDMTLEEEANAWIASSNAIIDAYGRNLYLTPFIMANCPPFDAPYTVGPTTEVVNRAIANYGGHFGVMSWALNAQSDTNFTFLPWILVRQYSSTNPVGLQFTCPAAGRNGRTLKGTFKETLDAGVAMGAQWLEIYSDDANNPSYADELASAKADLVQPPPPPTPEESYFLNLSTRVNVRTSDQVMIGGFIVDGDAPKRIVIRALGPSLAGRGVSNVLADPVLEIYNKDSVRIAENDNWVHPLPPDVVASGLTPENPAESLVAMTLEPGHYTAILRGANGGTGVALCELYDTEPKNSKMTNMSARGSVGLDDQAMISGFIIGGSQSAKVLVRALGPSLTQAGVSGALADPSLELHDGEGSLIFSNDNWRKDQAQQILSLGLAPSDNREAAIIAELAAGNYTAIVRGAGNTAGVALVEVYNLAGH